MLRLSKRSGYGLIALKHLAVLGPQENASAKQIADRYRIPAHLLSKVLQRLTRAGLLASVYGTRGGYRLARDPHRISALEVIRAIDGPVVLTSCSAAQGCCDQLELCSVREPLQKVQEEIRNLLAGITMKDLAGADAGTLSLPDGCERAADSPADRPEKLSALPG